MENIIIKNPDKVKEIQEKIISGGKEKFHVVADFDGTLTHSMDEKRNRYYSLIFELRRRKYISEDYAKKAQELADKYKPLERDESIPLEKRKEFMKSWWNEHFKLLIESGLKKGDIEHIVNSGIIRLRKGAKEFFDYLYKNKIPLIIISSSGIGDAIKIFLEKENLLYENIYIITNYFEWDENGNAKKVKRPIIHSLNKDETTLENYPRIYEEVKSRRNVLLLGNSLGDLGMIKEHDCDSLLKIGYFTEEENDKIKNYEENFDVVLREEDGLEYVNEFINKIN